MITTLSEFWTAIFVLCRIHDCSVTSGYRTQSRNLMVGGVETSQHLLGRAADLVPDDLSEEMRSLIVEHATKIGLFALDEGDHVHIHLKREYNPGVPEDS